MKKCCMCGSDAEVIKIDEKYKPHCTRCGFITEAEFDTVAEAENAWDELMNNEEAE